jgi:branched-subunit amino acid aminotransferase/4-amino-4-deoxychorismate lyase
VSGVTDLPSLPAETRPPIPLRETCRLVEGRFPLWSYHRARLARGGCGSDLLAEAERVVGEAVFSWSGPASSRLRLTVVVTPDGIAEATVQQRLSSLDVPGGPVTALVEVASPPWLPPGAAKPADRSWWDETQRRARWAGGHQAIIVCGGNVVDGGTASVWAVIDGVAVTPPAPDAVAGVARAFLLDALARAGVPVRVETLSAREFECADEAFLTNAFGGAVAVRGRSGPVFARVAAIFADMWRP